jgi:hypothetical protein
MAGAAAAAAAVTDISFEAGAFLSLDCSQR